MIEDPHEDLEPIVLGAAQFFNFETQGGFFIIGCAIDEFRKGFCLGRDAGGDCASASSGFFRLLLDALPLRRGGGDLPATRSISCNFSAVLASPRASINFIVSRYSSRKGMIARPAPAATQTTMKNICDAPMGSLL